MAKGSSKKAKGAKTKPKKKSKSKALPGAGGKAAGKSKDGKKKKGSKGSKKGKKKPLSKREMDLAKMRAEKEEQERAKREAEEKAAAEKKLAIEMAERAGHLEQSVSIIQSYDRWVLGKIARLKSIQEWKTFRACRNIPDFSKLYEVNSYLAYWLAQLEPPVMKKLLRLSPEFLQLISEMHDFLEIPPDSIRLDLIRELGLTYRDMVHYQQSHIDKCTYAIVEDLSDLYDPEVGICDYLLSIPEITHCLWGNLFQCPDINQHEFQELQFKFKIPESILTAPGIYRLIKTEYDHYSDSCLSYFPPGVENALKQSILDWIELHKLTGGVFTELQSPEDEKTKKGSKKKKGKKGKKRGKGSKKRKKGSKKKGKKKGKGSKSSGSGSGGTTTDYDDMDEEARKFYKEMESDGQKYGKGKKKKKKGKKGKKKGRGGGSTTDDSGTGYTTTDDDETDGERKDEAAKQEKSHRRLSEAEIENRGPETVEERRARRRREAEEAENVDFDFSVASKVGGNANKDESNLYDDDDDAAPEEKKKVKEKEKEEDIGDDEHDHEKKPKKKQIKEESEESKPKSKSKSKSRSKSRSRSKSGKKKRKSRSRSKGKKGRKGKRRSKSRSRSKSKKKGRKSRSKSKGKRRKGKSSSKSRSGSKSRSKSSSKSRSRSKSGKKGRKSRSKSKGKGRKGKSSSKSRSGSKSRSKSSSKSRSRSKSGKKDRKSRSKSKKKGRRSKSGSKSRSKSSSKSRSRSKSGKKGRKSRSKSKKKGRKSKSRSRSRSGSKKGKKKGKKKKKSKSRERPKTEAELAKERERAEKAKFIPQLHERELNLRNYNILGGIYHFNLLEIPPQPKLKGNWVIHLKEAESVLKELPFEADYVAPTAPDQDTAKKTPEEMEKEAKKQEEELQKLVLVDMAMPPSVVFHTELDPEEVAFQLQKQKEEAEAAFEAEKERRFSQLITIEVIAPKVALWFEPPTPVRWDPFKRIWSTEGFYDIKFNESSLQLNFRTVRFGTIGFGHNRWSNLPYQSWELRPLGKDKISFSLIAAMAVVEFIVMDDLICVSSLQNVTNSSEVEKAILNKYMKPKQLIQSMRYHGLDIFPEIDSYAYVDGILVKHFEAEDHLYQCMALVASAFNFQWSRWNLLAGRQKMVYQMRERHGIATPGNYSMVLTTPRKAIRINCTEVSPNYTEDPVADFEYYADLLNLVRAVATDPGLKIINQANPHHVEALRVLLTSIRPLSFS